MSFLYHKIPKSNTQNSLFTIHHSLLATYYSLFIVVGIISTIGQTVLLRELMVEVNGNEIIFSIFLSLWLLFVAIGTLLHKALKIRKDPEPYIYALLFVLLTILPLQFLLIRNLAASFSLITGLLIDIPRVILLALIILAPGCLLLGFLFPLNCRLIAHLPKSVHTVYIYETIGMVIGGILFFILINFAENFLLLVLADLICFILLLSLLKKRIFLVGTLVFLILLPFAHRIFIHNYATRYAPDELVESLDSKFGRLDVTESVFQKNYYWDGILFANSENQNYAEEMVNFVLLQHPHPERILLVGGLLNGYLDEIMKNPFIKSVDYLELEENIIQQSPYFQEDDPGVAFIQKDPVHFLKYSRSRYDIIYIDVPDPSSIQLNRFYTLEFFKLIKSHSHSEESVVAVTVSNAENYLLPELAKLNASVYHTFNNVFSNCVVIPASANIMIGSEREYITNNAEELIDRMYARENQGNWFNEMLIFERCNRFRLDTFHRAISPYKEELNTNIQPVCYLLTIQFWAKYLDVDIGKVIDFFQSHTILIFILSLIIVVLLPFGAYQLQTHRKNFIWDFNIVSISLVAFVMQIILLNLFQMHFGYVYFVIVIFTTSFMIGLAAGFAFADRIKVSPTLLFCITFSGIILLFFLAPYSLPASIYFIFNLLFAGNEGLILSRTLSQKQKEAQTQSGGAFYFLDTLGATLGGFLLGVFLLPIYGIRPAIAFLGILLLLNIVLIELRKRKTGQQKLHLFRHS